MAFFNAEKQAAERRAESGNVPERR